MADRIGTEAIESAFALFVAEARRNGLNTSDWVLFNSGGGAGQMRVMGCAADKVLYQLDHVPDSGWMGTTRAEVHVTLTRWTAGMRMVRYAREDRGGGGR